MVTVAYIKKSSVICDAWIINQKESIRNVNGKAAATGQKLTVHEVMSLVLDLISITKKASR